MNKKPTYEELEKKIAALKKKIRKKDHSKQDISNKSILLEAQFQISIDGILIVNSEGKIISFNKRMMKIWNIPNELLDLKDDAKLLQHAATLLKNPFEFLEKVEYLYKKKNEQSRDEIEFKDGRYFDRYSSPLIDSMKKYHGRIWFFRDITKRKKSKLAIEKLNHELELRVEKRTIELLKSNTLLKKKMNELQIVEKALRKNEENGRTLLNATTDSVLLVEPDGTYITVNKKAAERVGKNLNFLIGKSCYDYLCSQTAASRRKRVQEVVNTCKPVRFEDELGGKDYDHNFYPLLDSQGNVSRIGIFSRDITKEKKAIDILLKNENRFRVILKNLPGAVVVYDLKGRIQLVNETTCKDLGYSEKELLALSITDLNLDAAKNNYSRMWQNINYGETLTFESTILRKDGSKFPCEVYLQAFMLNEKPIILATGFNISERKYIEESLKYSKLQLEAVHNNMDAIIYISDMESYEILFMNNHLKKHVGKDLTGNLCWKSLHKNQDGPCEFCTNNNLIDADGNPTEPHIWEFYNQMMGKWFELHDIAIPWINGKLVRMEIAIDITARKQIERKKNELNELLEERVEERTIELNDLNIALRVLLKKREEDKKDVEEKILSNYESLVLPFLQKLNKSLSQKNQVVLLNIVESNIKELIEPFSKKINIQLTSLTPSEIQIAVMVKQGLANKEIAQTLNISIRTVSNHRDHIRRKLGIVNKKINLQSCLSAL